jgi:transcriptional regulator with XRE-family HTH domain
MIAQYEKGTRTGISADKLRVLARVLDLDAKELLPEREVEAAGEVFAGKAVALATVNG